MSGVRLDTAAKYVCEKANWRLTNLPLQKILYLAQVEYVGHFEGSQLIDTSFEAWDLGPVSPDLYHKVKKFGADPIQDIFYDALRLKDGTDRKRILDEIINKYISVRPGKLIELTHWIGGAWVNKYEPRIKLTPISNRDILEEYKNRNKLRHEWELIAG